MRSMMSSVVELTGETVATLFRSTVGSRPDAVALRWLAGDGTAGGQLTWAEYAELACRVAAGLADVGVGRGERVILMMRNRPEFHVVDIACTLLGATPVSIYNTSSPEQVGYLAGHAEARVAVAGDADQLERLAKAWSAGPARGPLVLIDLDGGGGAVPFCELLSATPVDFDAATALARPDDLATLIYTSGTTGPPKGVMITHRNIVWALESLRRAVGTTMTGWRQISYLPMAHIAERIVTHYLHLADGTEVTTCPDIGLLPSYLRAVRPQFFAGVPRVWEKLHAGIGAALAAAPAPAGADALAAVRAQVGLDCLQLAVTTAAPIPRPVLEFFRDIGVPLSEVFGMSEATGAIAWAPYRVKPGSIGPALPGQELKLLEDGEICYRGSNVFAGYLNDPERSAEVLDADGWLHSGDIGVIDDDGYLSIIDRKKELIVTAGGKNISPANLEAALKAGRFVAQACAIGDARPYVSALLVLDAEAGARWAAAHGLAGATPAELATHPDLVAEMARDVDAANEAFSQVERIKRFTVLPGEWLPDSDELTPTMKLKRRAILQKYADEIGALYPSPPSARVAG
jgi:long-chain acyl-CoA synthetase